jgi:hypothetical protein
LSQARLIEYILLDLQDRLFTSFADSERQRYETRTMSRVAFREICRRAKAAGELRH